MILRKHDNNTSFVSDNRIFFIYTNKLEKFPIKCALNDLTFIVFQGRRMPKRRKRMYNGYKWSCGLWKAEVNPRTSYVVIYEGNVITERSHA